MGDDGTREHGTRAGGSPDDPPPLLRIVRGEPDDAEIAALSAVVAALASAETAPERPTTRSRWADPASRLRLPARPGGNGWRASAYPA